MSIAALLGSKGRDMGECIIKVAGREFSAFYQNLITTSVNLTRRGSSEATLVFSVLREGANWPLEDNDQLRTWAKIEIIVVFGENEIPFFSGYIKEINTETGQAGNVGTVTVSCQDIYAAMDRNCRRVTWDEERDGLDIITEVIKPYGLKLKTDLTTLTLPNTHQNKTDFRFIRDLAGNHYEWYLRDQENGERFLVFGNVQMTADSSLPKLMIRAGRDTNCLSFNVSFDGYKPDQVRFSTAPVEDDEANMVTTQPQLQLFGSESSDSAASGLEPFEWCLPPEESVKENQAQAGAQAQADENAFKLNATGKLDGSVYGRLLMPGMMVEVGGSGYNDGKWYVDTTTHTFSGDGYFVEFTLIRNASKGSESSVAHILSGII